MVGVVGGKDLPNQPSEDEFRLALRSGIVLCNVLNKVQPGAVPKVGQSNLLIIKSRGLFVYLQHVSFSWLKCSDLSFWI